MFDYNNPEVRSAIIDLSHALGNLVEITPMPIQNGERIDGDYVFSESDVVGEIDPSITVDEINQYILDRAWQRVRYERNTRIALTDVWAMPDRTMSDEQIAYRQALRDITDTYDSINDIVWPTKPE